jgi:hypothetical protein
MVELKGKPDIGDHISKKIIGPLIKANKQLSQSDFPYFNDANKLGGGKELLPIQPAHEGAASSAAPKYPTMQPK